tara:strand:- start:9666 stop:10016 length:351 start_codon:yes stop_codon:yes gene_type:complete
MAEEKAFPAALSLLRPTSLAILTALPVTPAVAGEIRAVFAFKMAVGARTAAQPRAFVGSAALEAALAIRAALPTTPGALTKAPVPKDAIDAASATMPKGSVSIALLTPSTLPYRSL